MVPRTGSDATIRSFRPDRDFPALVALLNDIAATKGGAPTTEDEQRRQADWPGHDLASDRWVAVQGDRMVGFSDAWKAPSSPRVGLTLEVHPAQPDSLRARLLDQALARSREQGADSLLVYVTPGDASSRTFYETRDFKQVKGYRELTAPLVRRPLEPVWPEGLHLRTYEQVREPKQLIQASHRSFGDLWGHTVHPGPETTDFLLAIYPPSGIFLLYDADEVVGICKTCALPNLEEAPKNGVVTGYLDAPGVSPEYRSAALYRSLALAGLGWLYEHGHKQVMMQSWGDANETIAAYEALGFTTTLEEMGFYLQLSG